MKNTFDTKNSYLMSCVCCILLLMSICYFGITYTLKGTRAGFGGLTGCLSPTINVIYLPNYPEDIEEPEIVTKLACSQYLVMGNMYDAPLGYEFLGWDTNEDGSGNRYNAGYMIYLESEISLYAQWTKIITDTETDGDIENNLEDTGQEDSDGSLDDDNLSDGDSKNDDDVSSTEEDNDKGTTDDSNINSGNDNENSEGDSITEGSVGESDTGNGTDEDNSNQDTNNSQGNNNGNKVDSSTNKKPESNNNSKEESSSESEKIFYNFKFISDDKEYASNICEASADKTCLLVLPGVNPNKDGYIFTGWSLNKDCLTTEIITKPISVNGSNTYYACFMENTGSDTGVNFETVGIIIFVIWIVALTLIYCLVKSFKKKESNN